MRDPSADGAPLPLADQTVFGFRVLFLFGVLVGAALSGAVLVWTDVAARALADPCERPPPRPTYVAGGGETPSPTPPLADPVPPRSQPPAAEGIEDGALNPSFQPTGRARGSSRPGGVGAPRPPSGT